MKLKDLIDIMSCTNGYDLIVRVSDALEHIGVNVLKEDGSFKSLDDVLMEVAEVMNKEK
jgi:hypothetical protein